ncbi:hypothetical protein HDU98_005629 [Podochytrium sp. JEL0797]|nr:hypothetical protein HDU98_005629 [Podochytrium sp. JEL0797]
MVSRSENGSSRASQSIRGPSSDTAQRVLARLSNIRAMINTPAPNLTIDATTSTSFPSVARTTNTGRRSISSNIEVLPRPTAPAGIIIDTNSHTNDDMPDLLSRSSSTITTDASPTTDSANGAATTTANLDPIRIFETYLNDHMGRTQDDEEKRQLEILRSQLHNHPTTASIHNPTRRHPTNLPESAAKLSTSSLVFPAPPQVHIPPTHHTATTTHSHPIVFIDPTPYPMDHRHAQHLTSETLDACAQAHAIRTSGTGLARLLDANGCPFPPCGWDHVDLVMKFLCSGAAGGAGVSSLSAGNGDAAVANATTGATRSYRRRSDGVIEAGGGEGQQQTDFHEGMRNQRRRLARRGTAAFDGWGEELVDW